MHLSFCPKLLSSAIGCNHPSIDLHKSAILITAINEKFLFAKTSPPPYFCHLQEEANVSSREEEGKGTERITSKLKVCANSDVAGPHSKYAT